MSELRVELTPVAKAVEEAKEMESERANLKRQWEREVEELEHLRRWNFA
jgi:hypothetical protein